jgi:hypothetical protein
MPVDLKCTLEAGEPVTWTKQHGIIKRDSVATKVKKLELHNFAIFLHIFFLFSS